MSGSTLLICTVGGSPEPIVAALKQWRPVRVRFVHTPATKGKIAEILPKAREEGVDLDAGRYDLLELPDEQDFTSCVEHLRALTDEVRAWAARGDGCQVVVDITGGTKCMTAAMAIQASHWPCLFSYVGGKERTKDGVGIAVSGSEIVRHAQNPWDALGHQAVDEFVVLFDQHAYLAAANVAAATMRRVSRPDRKRELSSLEQLAKALEAWDRFDHMTSKNLLESVSKSANDLRAALGPTRGDRVLAGAAQLVTHLGQLGLAQPPSRHHVLDLLANAKRRSDEGRFDDAVARLYRATEAIAQVALKEGHGVESTEKVPLERIPESLRITWAPRADNGLIPLGLQDAYALLAVLNDPLGTTFQGVGLSGTKSPLVARNRSILAHGFERVSDAVFDKLWTSALSLANVDVASLPSFPTLVDAEGKS
ncbi:MAG: TIGR02710 family CRISPR-associated protein [Labilithrix sp.]|nr:TIGR02710 family CRISPR-associated protein [Labilithrix sp.]MCW5809446.1 TIGR02710 family CRISPR-associated protein [Labilithrix sp.]